MSAILSTTDPRPARKLSALRVLGPFLRPYRGRPIGAAAALALAAGLLLTLGQGVRQLIDQGFATSDRSHLDTAALGMVAVAAALGIATGTRFYLVSWLGERVAADMRSAMFARVLSLSPPFFETMRTGDVLTRLNTDTVLLQGLVGAAVSQWLRSLVIATGALAMLVLTSAKLAGIVLLVVPFVVLPLVLFARRERVLARLAQDRIADLGAYAEETLGALRTVQAFTHEAVDRAQFGDRVEASVAASMLRVGVRAKLLTGIITLGFGAITFSLWVGGLDVVSGRLSGGQLSAFVFYAVLLATSTAGIAELWGDVQRASGAAERIGELLDERPLVTAPADPAALPPVRAGGGEIAFEDVVFHYPSRPDSSALEGFSLAIRPGETVALVGPSGAGKTTVFQLLLRFYDPRSGRVRLDGVDLRDTDPEAVRGRIGLVSQEPTIFGANVWDNIRYGRPGATDAEVRRAAEAAAAGFADELPQGFDTFLGEKGVRLSGGQRQRIAIARAILRDAPVLLLDEATSALDAESEAAVQHALAVLASGRTTLVIAHRLATVRRADRIIVLDRGRVVATGTHEALVRSGGLYARLAELQFAA